MWEEQVVRVVWRHYQDWVLPTRVLRIILTLALLCVFVGMVLVSVGGGLHYSSLLVAGGVSAGVGGLGLLVCLLMCMHACFVFRVRDQAVQTEDNFWDEEGGGEEMNAPHHHPTTNTCITTTSIPGNTVLLPPSALRHSDSSMRREPTGGTRGAGGAGADERELKKSVTYSGEVQCYSPPSSPALSSSSSLLSSVFSSTAGTLERNEGGGRGGGGGRVGAARGHGHGYHHHHNQYHHHHQPHHPLPSPHTKSQSLPGNLRLQKLLEELDCDAPAQRIPMLAGPPPAVVASGSSRRPFRAAPEVTGDRGSVKSAGAEKAVPSSLYLSRNRHGKLEPKGSSKISDYDNI